MVDATDYLGQEQVGLTLLKKIITFKLAYLLLSNVKYYAGNLNFKVIPIIDILDNHYLLIILITLGTSMPHLRMRVVLSIQWTV